MGTVSLVESFVDIRNLSTIFFYIILVRMVWMAFIHGDLTLVMVKIHATNKDQSKDQLLTLFCFPSGIISGVLVDDIAIFTRIKFILPRWIRRC